MLNRRQFAGSLIGAFTFPLFCQAAQSKKKIAFVATDLDRRSHGQFFFDRYSIGYAMGGAGSNPRPTWLQFGLTSLAKMTWARSACGSTACASFQRSQKL